MRDEQGTPRFAGLRMDGISPVADLIGGLSSAPVRRRVIEDRGRRKIWEQVRYGLRAKVGPQQFEHWIMPLSFVAEVDDEVLLAAPSEAERDRARNQYGVMIQSLWSAVDPAGGKVTIVARSDIPEDVLALVEGEDAPDDVEEIVDDAEDEEVAPGDGMALFDSFIVGGSNRIAHGIMKRLATGRGVASSIAMIVGPHGVGKTLILRGVESALQASHGDAHVIYMSAEDFMLAFVDGVKRRDTSELRKMIRRARVIMLDDFQFICSRPGTLTEFFSHVRAVSAAGGVIVLAGDQAPSALPQLDSRMRDELQGGAYAEIGLPELALRREIVRASVRAIAETDPEFNLPEEFVELMAQKLASSGRALHGAVRNVYVGTTLLEKPITAAAVEKAIQLQIGTPGMRRPRIEVIKDIVANAYGVTKADMESSSRKHSIAHPRQYAMYFCRKLTTASYPLIGKKFGDRDHTTILYAFRKITKRLASDRRFMQEMLELEYRILSDQRNAQ
ncbi:AAA family ATPase [bacterium]|nr:AAA family ATPase [bacterium]